MSLKIFLLKFVILYKISLSMKSYFSFINLKKRPYPYNNENLNLNLFKPILKNDDNKIIISLIENLNINNKEENFINIKHHSLMSKVA